ncbi:MAG: IreB family regulatory phosphoprotein [Clostridia bacterium]|nr:IreB family regulatory phosphoprotein [Clostridia bacterium]
MPDTTKFLYLDHTDTAPATHECASPCPCCEASLTELISIIRDCGQDPVTQLSGYLITEDPTYLPEAANANGITARAIARRVGRDKILTTLIELYLSSCPAAPSEKA